MSKNDECNLNQQIGGVIMDTMAYIATSSIFRNIDKGHGKPFISLKGRDYVLYAIVDSAYMFLWPQSWIIPKFPEYPGAPEKALKAGLIFGVISVVDLIAGRHKIFENFITVATTAGVTGAINNMCLGYKTM